jgi:hypothetical protein
MAQSWHDRRVHQADVQLSLRYLRSQRTAEGQAQDLCGGVHRSGRRQAPRIHAAPLSEWCVLLVWARDIENVRVGVATDFAKKLGRLLGE